MHQLQCRTRSFQRRRPAPPTSNRLPESTLIFMPGTSRTKRDYHYTTSEVLQKTLMSRAALIRYVRTGKFPSPKLRPGDKGAKGADWYCKHEVNEWIEKNTDFVSWRQKKISETFNVTIEADQVKHIREACKLLECDELDFIRDAAVWKADQVKKLTANEPSIKNHIV